MRRLISAPLIVGLTLPVFLVQAATPLDEAAPPPPSVAPSGAVSETHAPGRTDRDGDGLSDALQASIATADPGDSFDVLVTFSGPGSAASVQRAVGSIQLKHEFRVIHGFAASMTAAQIQGLAHTPGIFRIEEDFKVSAHLVEARADYGADRAQRVDQDFPGYDGSDIGICVIDTGIDAMHEQLAGKVDGFCDAWNGGCNIDPETGAALDSAVPYDDHGHGTHVAGIAAGQGGAVPAVEQYRGVAPAARLYGAKVLSSGGFGYGSAIVKGIDWCASREGVHVLNLSLGGGPTDGNDAVSLAVDCAANPDSNATCNDIPELTPRIVVTSAGNSGPMPNTVGTPAVAREAIAVGAMGSAAAWNELRDRRGHLLIAFSSRGPTPDGRIKPDIVAPGTGITSAFADTHGSSPGVHGGYLTLSGTSLAAPYTAGTVALMIQAMQDADPARVPGDPLTLDDVQNLKKLLYSTAQDRGPLGQDIDWGWGAIDTFLAVAMAAEIPANPTEFGRHERLEAMDLDLSDWDYSFFVGDISKPISATVINGDAGSCLAGGVPCSQDISTIPDIEAELYDPSGTLIDLSTCAGDPSEDRDPSMTICGRPGPIGEGRQETLFVQPLVIGWYTLRLYPSVGDTLVNEGPATAGIDLVYGDELESDDPPAVLITGPVPGSTLSGATETFTWTANGTSVENYDLWFGSSVGAFDLGGTGGGLPGSQTSYTKTGLPTDGRTVHVRFWFKVAGVWSSRDYSYTAFGIAVPPSPPEITGPEPGSTLSGATETFAWDPRGTVVENYDLWFGSSVGTFDLGGTGGGLPGSQTSYTKTGLLTDGRTIFVRFWFKIGGVWQRRDYSYTAALAADPEIVSPVPGSILSGPKVTFAWDPRGTVVENYDLWFGSSPGAFDLGGTGGGLPGSQTSYTKTGLPTDGRTIFVRFWFKIGGVWQRRDYSYTAATLSAQETVSSVPP